MALADRAVAHSAMAALASVLPERPWRISGDLASAVVFDCHQA